MKREWRRSRLGDVLRIKHGYAFKGEFFSDSGAYVLLTPGNFEPSGGLKLKGEKEKFYSGDFPAEFLLSRDDLLIAMTDLTQSARILGSPGVVPESGRFLHNQRLGKVVDLNDHVMDRRFLYHLLNAREVREQVKASATGATVRHTAPERIYAVEVSLPPLQGQRRIASILSAYDDLIENNTRRITILEEMARRIYEEWFVRFRFPGHEGVRMVESELGLVPEGWPVVRLDEVLVLQRGFDLPKQDRTEGPFPIVSATGASATHHECRVKGPGVVTGRSGSLGTVLYVETDFWPLNTTLWVKEFLVGNALYAYYVLQSIDLAGFNSGAAVPTLNRNDVHGLPVLRPPVYVLAQFDELVAPMVRLKHRLESINLNLRKTRDLLLPKLISGEFDVSEMPEPEALAA